MGGLWVFISAHGVAGAIFFSLRQLEIAKLVRIRPYNAVAFLGPLNSFKS
jgi:photosystem II P680 reaction center D2 protein